MVSVVVESEASSSAEAEGGARHFYLQFPKIE